MIVWMLSPVVFSACLCVAGVEMEQAKAARESGSRAPVPVVNQDQAPGLTDPHNEAPGIDGILASQHTSRETNMFKAGEAAAVRFRVLVVAVTGSRSTH